MYLPNEQAPQDMKKFVYIVYILQALGFIFLVTPVIGVILNFIKKEDYINQGYYSHYKWQQNTFWFSLLWGFLGTMTMFLFIGYIVLMALTVWYVYRIAKGWIYLSDGKELYV